MVSEEKKKEMEKIKELIKKYTVIGLMDLYKMPSRQLQAIRKSMRDNALIKMCKKRLIKRVLDSIKDKENIQKILEFEPKEPALIFTDLGPFKIYKMLKVGKSWGYAKTNDIAPNDIIVKAGPTKLMAGPAIGELQRVKIPAMVKEGKIHVREDTVVVKNGELITDQLANVLKKLDVQPMEIRINLLCVWEDGIVYGKDVLDIDEKEFIRNIKNAYNQALNLCINVCYFNKESIKMLLQKAYQEGMNLGINTNILDKGIVEVIIKKANAQAQALSGILKI